MKRVMFLLLLAMAIAPEAWAQTWPNEPSGSQLLSDWNWNSLTGGGWTDSGGDRRIIADPTAPFSPSNILESRHLPNQMGGANSMFFFPTTLNELYVGFWWKPSNPFSGVSTNQQKFALIESAAGGHTYLLMSSSQQGGPYVFSMQLNYTTVSNAHLGNGWGDSPGTWNLFANQGNAGITLGTWHRIEVYWKKSTSPTSRDGILRWWMDGQLLGNYTAVNFPAGFSFADLTCICNELRSSSITDYHWYDHVRVTAPTGGSGTPKGDTTPPAAPVNLRAQ